MSRHARRRPFAGPRPLRLERLEARETPAAVSGLVFVDYNGSGLQNGTEPVFAGGATVNFDANGDGTTDATTTTGANGQYTFTTVPDGSHKVSVAVPAGFTMSSANPQAVAISGGADAAGVNFGVRPNGKIAGVVYDDANANGVQDAGELGKGGVTVAVDFDGDGSTNTATTTAGDGTYSVAGVPDGTHAATVTLAGYTPTAGSPATVTVAAAAAVTQNFGVAKSAIVSALAFTDTNGDGTLSAGEKLLAGVSVALDGGTAVTTDATGTARFTGVANGSHTLTATAPAGSSLTSAASLPVTVANGKNASNFVFGVRPAGSISGSVFADANANGVRDAGELGVAGATVSFDANADGTVDGTATTAADGTYTVPGVGDGTHTLSVTKAGLAATTANPLTVTVAGGATAPATFGLAAAAVVSGVAFTDYNGDGTQNSGEPGLPDVIITLDAGGKTATTDSAGKFAFTAVADGAHTLTAAVPGGTAAIGGATKTFTVTAGASVAGQAFAFQPTGKITGLVYADANGNGTQDNGELALAGVTVTLDRTGDGTSDAAAVTTAAGTYTFAGVPDGGHKLAFALAGFAATAPTPVSVTVAAGATLAAPPLGLAAAAVLGITAFNDANGNGTQDTGESGLAGVLVSLDAGPDGTPDATNTTAANGFAAFTGLADGTYAVKAVVPAGYAAVGVSTATITVANGVAGAAKFAFRPTGAVSGVAFNDANVNGVRDAGELGLGGATISIDTNADGSPDAVATTAADGTYTLTNLPDGTFAVTAKAPASGNTTISPATVTIAAGTPATLDFGFAASAVVSGVVFSDVNKNGVRDKNEPGVFNVVVALDAAGGKTTTTDGNGFFAFAAVADGTHKVLATAPAGYLNGAPNGMMFAVAGGANLGGVNLPLSPDGTLTGVVFTDLNLNQSPDAGEAGLGGLTVTLDLFGDGTPDATATTAADGTYTFNTVPDGTHTLTVAKPGFEPTTPNPAFVTFSGGVFLTPPVPAIAFLPPRAGVLPFSFTNQPFQIGLVPRAVVVAGGFADTNGNGTQDFDEVVVPGVTIQIDGNADGTVDFTGVTGDGGNAIFTGVPDGTHAVTVVAPAGYSAVTPTQSVTIAGGVRPAGLAFALRPAGQVTGTAFTDTNADGVRDAGEPALAGVTVSLIIGGDAVAATATTGADGTYSFPGLTTGEFTVKAAAAGLGATTANPAAVTLTGTSPAGTADFGFAKAAVVSGFAFADYDGNGKQGANEPGLPNVTVGLDAGANGTVDFTTTTSATGRFAFTGVADGAGQLLVTLPAGFTATTATTLPVAVAGGAGVAGLGFGLRPSGGVAGLVFADANGNGVRDANEAGVAGVTVTLDATGDGTPEFTAATGPDGNYLFAGVPDANYRVGVTPPAGYLPPANGNPPRAGFVAGANVVTGVNFGVIPAAAAVVAIPAFYDANGNGTRDAGEAAVANVFLLLANGTGFSQPLATGADGVARFVGVPDGAFTLTPTAPAGYELTAKSATFTVSGGVAAAAPAVGVRPTGVTATTAGRVAGVVFEDANGNGTQDAGEPGLAGATVRLAFGVNGSPPLADAPQAVATTAADGTYSFANVPDGQHTLAAAAPGAAAGVAAAAVAAPVTAGGTTTKNVGLTVPRAGGVTVFIDRNANGLFDAGEQPAAGVVVTATGPTTNIVSTNSGGFAGFTGLADGNYAITLGLAGATITGGTTSFNVLNGAVSPTTAIGFRYLAATTSTVIVGTNSPGINTAVILDGNGQLRPGAATPSLPTATGVRTAAADVNGDGVDDYIVGTGPGQYSYVRVIDGKTGAELFNVFPFESAFTGGVFVAAGDITGDGRADVIITPDQGGGPRVRVFDGNGFAAIADFYGIDDPAFRGGARAAVGDVSGDGVGDLIVAAGFGGGPRVAGFDGPTVGNAATRRKVFADYFAFEQSLRNGVYVAAGDIDGDGFADVIAGGGPGGGPRVFAVSGRDLTRATNTVTPLANFFAGGGDADRTGAKVAVKDLDGDARADIVVGYKPAATGTPRLAAYVGSSLTATGGTPGAYFDVEPYPGFTGELFVG